MRLRFACAVVLALLARPAHAAAQQSYEDLSGRFVFDLPPGWKMSQDLGSDLRQFKGSGVEALFVGFLAAVTDRDALCAPATGALATNSTDHRTVDAPVNFELNGSPARWAVYTGKSKTPQPVPLFNLSGCVLLPDAGGGVYFFSILNEKSRDKMGAAIKASFESIRAPGAQRTGVQNAQAVVVSSAPTPFTHELVTLTLPPGWTLQPKAANAEPELIATFALKEGGINAVLSGQKTFGDLSVIVLKVRHSIESAMPNAKPTGELMEITTGGGDKAVLQGFTGTVLAGGKEIALGALLAATRNDQRGLAFQFYFPTTSAERAGKEAAAILQSIR